ncbi:hypothetical protein FGG08_002268 [Glutinoglossum americanum]|uniref:N-acetyltransferase domain-containing protein n=1 Tax=Glutinoglossum americanum TaxID=1670608 RepID=A0A9P8I9J5_9PEZI|nr:hypothetical protein FGG08_002268 [Glutinoglossum americanum]
MSSILPALPFQSPLRLATLADLPSISLIATRGFYTSQVFRYERPLHAQYSSDTAEDYRRAFEKRIRGDQWVVVVAKDVGDAGMEVVGVCCWRLPEGSGIVGWFQQGGDGTGDPRIEPQPTPWISRDKSPTRVRLVQTAIQAAHSKHFPPTATLIVDMLAVHPVYQRRGHGRALVEWGIQLARLDGLGVGTVASNMGELLFGAMGFRGVERVRVRDEGEDDEGIEVVVVWREREVLDA